MFLSRGFNSGLQRTLSIQMFMVLLVACTATEVATGQQADRSTETGWYLFAGFKGNGEDGVYYATSSDGYRWKIANHGRPVIKPIETGELMRDPFIQRDPGGGFQMVWTWAWGLPAVAGHSSSKDLLHWSQHKQVPLMANEPMTRNVWAPALYWNAQRGNWLLIWSSTVAGRFAAQESGENKLNHRIYSSTTSDFNSFTPAALFLDPGYNVIDAIILPVKKTYHLFFKDERKDPLHKFILTSQAKALEGPWISFSEPLTDSWNEGPSALRIGKEYVVYFDHYRAPQRYGAISRRISLSQRACDTARFLKLALKKQKLFSVCGRRYFELREVLVVLKSIHAVDGDVLPLKHLRSSYYPHGRQSGS